jgi:aspartate--ammonia ligase
LRKIVTDIYSAILHTEFALSESYPQLKPSLPERITFIHSEELRLKYPTLSPKERENEIARQYGAVFIIDIGGRLSNGEPHDGRAADYDDWSTPNEDGYFGLNGDILLWNPVLNSAFEVSSMGIRVDAEALMRQLTERGEEHKTEMMFHRMLLAGELPLTVGGGIGQSRLCMYLLRKAHIGEIQSSIWDEQMRADCEHAGMHLM